MPDDIKVGMPEARLFNSNCARTIASAALDVKIIKIANVTCEGFRKRLIDTGPPPNILAHRLVAIHNLPSLSSTILLCWPIETLAVCDPRLLARDTR